MQLGDRENIEWTNCWWSRANKSIDRILLIGDSVIRGVRGDLERFMIHQYAVDLFAASLDMNDDLFWKHVKLFMDTAEYTYKCIIVQYGFHHGLNRRCVDSKTFRNNFKIEYRKLIEMLKQYCPYIVLMTGNSEVYADQIDILDKTKEQEIVCRNKILYEIAKEFGCPVFDLHFLMHEVENDYKHIDAQHYEKDANLFIAYELYIFLIKKKCVCPDKILSRDMEQQQICNVMTGIRKIIIYGTGMGARKLFLMLKRYFHEMESIQFAESCPEKEKRCLRQTVIGIDEVPIEDRNNVVLVISSSNNREAMRTTAEQLKFSHILYYEDIWNVFN